MAGLKRGDRGDEVRRFQLWLMAQGIDLPQWGADGILGDETLSGARRYESQEGLPQDTIPAETLYHAETAWRAKLAQENEKKEPGLYIKDGVLYASPVSPYFVFHAPTKERRRQRQKPSHLVLHHTACKANERPNEDLPVLIRQSGMSEEEAARLISEIGKNPIPSIVSLALQGARDWSLPKGRASSWDFGIGDGPLAYLGGKVPIVQPSPNLDKYEMWHARQANRYSKGIEVLYYGYLFEKNGKYWFDGDGPRGPAKPIDVTGRLPGGTKTFEGKLCEQLHPKTKQALFDLVDLMVMEYGFSRENLIGHRDVEPNRRSDPHPAYTVEEVRRAIFGVG